MGTPCSVCGDPIPDLDDLPEDFTPLRLYRKPSVKHPHGQEARFCPDCAPAVLKYMHFKQSFGKAKTGKEQP